MLCASQVLSIKHALRKTVLSKICLPNKKVKIIQKILHLASVTIELFLDKKGIKVKCNYFYTACFLGVFSSQCIAAFDPPVTYVAGANPMVGATADLNNDGSADMVSANYSDTSVSVFLNNGDGSFAAKIDYASGDALEGTQVVATGDMDSDGDTDLIVSNFDGRTIKILWNNGDATFTAPTLVVSTTVNPGQLVTADFNADGHQDFAFASDTMFVYLNDGLGGFSLSDSHFISVWTWNTVAEDLNGDGSIDLAVPDVAGENIQVLMNNGNGTFTAPVSYPTPSPKPLAVVDLNQDASPDMVIGSYLNDTMTVFMNDGEGNFTQGGVYPVSIGDGGVGVVAMDYSEHTVLRNNCIQNIVSVVMNNGDGTLGEVVQYTVNSPLWPASGDFNNDGVDDLMVTQWADNLVSVFMNQPVFVDLKLKVKRAEVEKNKSEVEFRASFSMDSLPDPSDEVNARFGGVDLGTVVFSEFKQIRPNVYRYRDAKLEIKLNFNRNVIVVERESVDLSLVDLASVDVQVTIGNSLGADNISLKVNRYGDYVYRVGNNPCSTNC